MVTDTNIQVHKYKNLQENYAFLSSKYLKISSSLKFVSFKNITKTNIRNFIKNKKFFYCRI